MALSGNQRAYLQARSGIARSGAIRSNYVFPLYGVVTVGGVNLTKYIQYGTLRITQQLNEEPDTCTFNARITDAAVQSALVVGRDVLIGLGGAAENALFGGRILSTQTTREPNRTPAVCSVMCADYLQVVDSEYLITYGWPAQSTTTTILDLCKRFTSKTADFVAISPAGVAAGLPSHAAFSVSNERFSTVLRRLVTLFPTGGGFVIDPLKVLHVWQGASAPGVTNPQPLTIDLPSLKAFAETVDGSQQRDAVIVEGRRTSAPIGLPDVAAAADIQVLSIPVDDASIGLPLLDPGFVTEIRIGTQRVTAIDFVGPWKAPVGTPTATKVTTDVAFNPDPGLEGNTVTIPVESTALLAGRVAPWCWVRINDQYLRVDGISPAAIVVPRTGFGAMVGPIEAEAAVSTVDSLAALRLTDRYHTHFQGTPGDPDESIRAQPIGSDVVLTVRPVDTPGIHEHFVQDGRYNRDGAQKRGAQEIADFKLPTKAIEFETEDLNAKPGRLVSYSFDAAPLTPTAGELMILSSEISWPVWGQLPRIRCRAAMVRAASVTDTWVTDTR